MQNERQEKEENSFEEQNYYYPNNRPSLSKSQKIAVVALVFFAIFIVIFWIMQFKNDIKESLKPKSSETENSVETENNAELLSNKDTDGDGLSDWDELNNYMTSPYIEDSDSDGYSDKQEVDTNNDPNCPMGQSCLSTETQTGTSSPDINGLVEGLDIGLENTQNIPVNAADNLKNNLDQNSANNLLGGEMDAASLRKLLKDSGFDAKVLEQINDEELLKIYKESLTNKN